MLLELCKALADPCRLRLIAVLLNGEFTVQELTRIFAMGQSRISHHLKILTEAGLLGSNGRGPGATTGQAPTNRLFAALRPAFEPELELAAGAKPRPGCRHRSAGGAPPAEPGIL